MNQLIVSAVMQLCKASVAAYDLYLDVNDFPPAYIQLRFSLVIERHRLQIWARNIIDKERSAQDETLWALFKAVLIKILAALEGGTRTMEEYEQDAGFPKMANLSGGLKGCLTASTCGIRTGV
jgi:hypothetical protein